MVDNNKLLLRELRGCYDFFTEETNSDKNSLGYGLVRDKYPNSPEISSVAAVGYGLASLIIGVKHNWVNYDDAKKRAVNTLKTVLNNLQRTEGFYYHFINLKTGTREWNSEISIIDTGILSCGVIAVGEFFNDNDEIKCLSEQLYCAINWEWFVDKGKNMFYLGYKPEEKFYGNWDVYAEQLMLYILGAGSPTYPVDKSLYDSFKKDKKDYKEYKDIVASWFGSLFTYQFSHAWIDFKDKTDENGINWWENSRRATLANRQYCIDSGNVYNAFNENSWGLTASVCPGGYSGEFGALPASVNVTRGNDGTIAPYGAISSICFTPEESKKALEYYYSLKGLVGKYGLNAAYNLNEVTPWYSNEVLGIDKGITMLMIENYLENSIWSSVMKNKHIIRGLEKNKIKKIV